MEIFESAFNEWFLQPDLGSYLLVMDILATALVVILALIVGSLLTMYVRDKWQKDSALRANYPILVRFRYWMEEFGKFFRAWLLSEERVELPFNRAERAWVYRAAKGLSTYNSFGSTRPLNVSGSIIFVNSPYPVLEENSLRSADVTIGEGGEGVKHVYRAHSFFNISGMSYGAISRNAVLSLAGGAALSECWINTGEGGVSPYHLQSGADIIAQIGTAKYGVRDLQGNLSADKLRELAAHENIRMFEVKISQGAKPGAGGVLPGGKVTREIAEIRGIEAGKYSISPNRHPEISNDAEMLDFIKQIRSITGKPVGIKLVLGDERSLVSLLDEIKRRGMETAPDFMALDSADGGTGAAPMSLMDYVGLPIKESLPMLSTMLETYGFKERIKIIASGKMITPPMAAWAMAMGADFIASARGFMFSLGCIQALQCAENNCPTGIATQNPKRYRALNPRVKTQRVHNYHKSMVAEVERIAHSCGAETARHLRREHVRILINQFKSVAYGQEH